MNISPNDPVFPTPANPNLPGLTIRTLLAGMAMQAVLAITDERGRREVANDAVLYADAVIDELNNIRGSGK